MVYVYAYMLNDCMLLCFFFFGPRKVTADYTHVSAIGEPLRKYKFRFRLSLVFGTATAIRTQDQEPRVWASGEWTKS